MCGSGDRNMFEVYKMDGKMWEKVYSLEGEEALVRDLSVT